MSKKIALSIALLAIVNSYALAQKDREVMAGVRISRVPYFYPYLGLSDAAKQLLDRKGGNLFSFALMRVLKQYPGLDLIHLHTAKRPGGIGRCVLQRHHRGSSRCRRFHSRPGSP